MSEKSIKAKPLSEDERLLCQMVDDNREELIKLLQDLIYYPSITHDPEIFSDLHDIMNFSNEFMQKSGFNTKIYECPHKNDEKKTWPNLIAFIDGDNKEKNIRSKTFQFMGHLDIVPFEKEKWDDDVDPIKSIIKDGKIFGRGTADMKGGVAAQMMACKILKKSKLPINGRLQLWCVPDEEINGNYGAQFMSKKHKDVVNSDATIIGEPTGQPPIQSPAIILGEKGHQWLRMKVYGSSGHGSMPKPKSNAINKAVNFISKSKKLKLPKVKAPLSPFYLLKTILSRFTIKNLLRSLKDSGDEEPDPYNEDSIGVGNFFKSTISFTQIHAGKKVNVIPDICEFECDIRILPGIKTQDVYDSIAHYCTKIGYRIEFPEGYKNPQSMNEKIQKRPVDIELSNISLTEGTFVRPEGKFIDILSDVFESVYNVKSAYFFAPGSTDAVHMREEGIENVVILGPSGLHMHDANEFVYIEHLVNICKVYLITAYRFLSKKN